MIELTEEELYAVAGGQNHGQATSDAVHWAQSLTTRGAADLQPIIDAG